MLFSILIACQSPTDIDTPRNKTLPQPIDSLQLTFKSLSIETNGETVKFIPLKAMFEIDTNSKNPLIWGNLEISSDYIINFGEPKLFLSGLKLKILNMPISPKPVLLKAGNYIDSYASFLINRGISAVWNQEIICDSIKNKSEISFNHNIQNKEIWIYLDTKINANRVFIKDENLAIIDSVEDILFIKARFQFIY